MDAHGVFAVTGDDSRNLMIVFHRQAAQPERAHRGLLPRGAQRRKLRKAGADSVISPDFTGGMRIARHDPPHVVSFLDEMLRPSKRCLEEVLVPERFEPRP